MTVRRLLAALLVALTGLALTVVPGGTAGAVGQPRLSASSDSCSGLPMPIGGSGFTPGQDYQFSATQGSFESGTLTADQDGQLIATLDVPPEARPNTYITVTVAATSAPDTVVAMLTLSGFQPSSVRASGQAAYSVLDAWPPNSKLLLDTRCFQPGENVELSSPQLSLSPPTIKYLYGVGFVSTTVLAVDATGMATVTVTGAASGHQATSTFSTGGAVLDAGTELRQSGAGQLISASGGYRLLLNSTDIYVCRFPPTQTQDFCDQTWSTPISPDSYTDSATLQLRSDGDLVLLNGPHLIWSTGTVGAGNRLTLHDDGNLALTSSRGDLLWSSKTGLAHGAAGAVSAAYIAGSRSGRVLYVNGLIKQWAGAGQLVRSPHRLVYLQRYLNRRWQNMLARTTDGAGQFTVGFIQPSPQLYRLIVASATGVTGARSAILVR
jgi:hypothetical protein